MKFDEFLYFTNFEAMLLYHFSSKKYQWETGRTANNFIREYKNGSIIKEDVLMLGGESLLNKLGLL